MPPDFERARQYALDRLKRELSPALSYHCAAHTAEDVVPAAERLASLEGVSGDDLLLLRTAAYFHDLGFIETREEHERVSVGIARAMLPEFGYAPAQAEAIAAIVLATRLPQTPDGPLGAILADADLDVLGREDYWARNEDLRAEWAVFGQQMTDREWHENQLAFLSSHQYFTRAARETREPQKQANIVRLRELLDGL
jgi:uncharacterized protein